MNYLDTIVMIAPALGRVKPKTTSEQFRPEATLGAHEQGASW
jgi:hypothetical protein